MILHGVRSLAERHRRDPIAYVRWLPVQHAFLSSASRCKQIRLGNQDQGKTTAALAEVIGRCVGRHPLAAEGLSYPTPGPGFEAWVICDSWSQAVTIMGKLWALLPKDDLDPATVFNPATGFRGKNPYVKFRNGAILRIKTANQDPKSLASGTIDVALFDEPPPNERIFVEVQQRLQTKGGILLLSYTPVNAPVAYLKQYVAEGRIEDHHGPLTAAALIPVGATKPVRGHDGRLRDAAWVIARRKMVPEVQAPVVLDGEWEFRSKGAYFEGAWDAARMVHESPPNGEVFVLMGFDHGSRPGKQFHVLALVQVSEAGDVVYILDEYSDETGQGSHPEDARGTIAMLQRHGWAWTDLDDACGDRVHMPGAGQQKSNLDLQAAIARQLRIPASKLKPPIRTSKRGEGRGRGAPDVGARWLHYAMVQGRFAVHPRCKRLIAALPKYTGDDDDSKDPIDALRYALDSRIFRRYVRPAAGPALQIR
jgi:hypothetical protein